MEKKLTDEEIVKALELRQSSMQRLLAYVDGCACKHIRVADILDLIRSLRQRVSILEADNDDYKMKIAENELVSIDWHNEQVMYLQDENNRLSQKAIELEVETNNQKAEIERLANANMQTIGKNAELLLQVDELKEENAQLSEMADYDKGHKEGYEHGAKTTAKEILTDAKKWVKEHYKDTVTDSFGERPMLFMEAFGGLLAYLKDKHGVEEQQNG